MGGIIVGDVNISPISDSIAIQVTSFKTKQMIPQTMDKLRKFEQQEFTSLIIDLRNNSGGFIFEAIGFGALFVTKNQLIKLKKKDNTPLAVTRPKNHPFFPTKRLIILINNKTASAAEAAVNILNQHPNRIIIGEKTYGKHSITSHNKATIYNALLISEIRPDIYLKWLPSQSTQNIYLQALAIANQREN